MVEESEITLPDHYSISWALQNVKATIKIYLETLYENTDSYIWTAFGSRHTDIFIPTFIIAAVLFLFLIVCATERDLPKITIWHRAAALLSGGGVLFLIMTVMFLLWIDFGANVIDGVNGRYLLPWYVCLPVLLKNKTFELKKDISCQALTGMVFLNIIIMLFIFSGLLRW